MIRKLVMTMIVTSALGSGTCGAADPPETDNSNSQVAELARQALAKRLNVGGDTFNLVSIEPHTWNDAGMGCAKPGTQVAQVVTEGHIVKLDSQGRTYPVHVSGQQAIVCDRLELAASEARRGQRSQGIETAVALSRQDLAQRLKADQKDLRLTGVRPQRWPDSTLGCPRTGEMAQGGEVSGFQVALSYQGRIYTYHASANEARACPAIENE